MLSNETEAETWTWHVQKKFARWSFGGKVETKRSWYHSATGMEILFYLASSNLARRTKTTIDSFCVFPRYLVRKKMMINGYLDLQTENFFFPEETISLMMVLNPVYENFCAGSFFFTHYTPPLFWNLRIQNWKGDFWSFLFEMLFANGANIFEAWDVKVWLWKEAYF